MSLNTTRGSLRLVVECPYEERHLLKLATFGTARWRKDLQAYSCPPEPVLAKRIVEYLPKTVMDLDVRDWASRMAQNQLSVIASTQDSSPLSEKPLVPFQMSSVRFLAEARSAILGHEMGTGKTPISCVALDYVGAAKVLIVCPNSVKWSWVAHLRDWSDERTIYVLESTPVPGDFDRALPLVGNKSKREDLLAEVLTKSSECVVILNYSQLRIHEKVLKSFDYDAVIADEAHRVNNRRAQQTAAFKAVAAKSAYVWMLTGTPVRNNYTDLFSLLSVCDPLRFSSYWNFVHIHLNYVPGYWGGVDIIGLRDPEGFNSLLSTFMYRVTKQEAMPELPEKLYTDYQIAMHPEQYKVYQQMEDEFIIAITAKMESGESFETVLRAPNVVSQLIRLRQICLAPELLGNPASSAKLEALSELLQDIDGPFIVFSCFRQFLNHVSGVLKGLKIPYAQIVGGQSSWEREAAVGDLNSGKVRCILGTIQSMGEGLNLQTARTAIFCDIDWVPAVNDQAEDRIHRGKITESPVIIRLNHPGTVESDILSACSRKRKIVGDTTGSVEAVRQMLLRKKSIVGN